MNKKVFDKNQKGKKNDDFETKMIDLARVTRVVAGGRRFRFRAVVVAGDRNGRVGLGVAKGRDVAIAVNKAGRMAKKNLIKVFFVKGTIPYEVEAKYNSSKIILKPASEGRGIVAGGPPRIVLELAGARNVIGKILSRSSNAINNAKATIKALSSLKPVLPKKNISSKLYDLSHINSK